MRPRTHPHRGVPLDQVATDLASLERELRERERALLCLWCAQDIDITVSNAVHCMPDCGHDHSDLRPPSRSWSDRSRCAYAVLLLKLKLQKRAGKAAKA